MKKNVLSLLFVSGIAVSATAQPVLTSSINQLSGDSRIMYYNSANQQRGNSGTNVTWDFSTLTPESNITMQYTTCTGNSACSPFPGSTLAGNSSNGSSGYLILDNNRQAMNGYNATGTSIIYSDPQDILHFPFTYGNTYDDYFAASFSSNGIVFYRKGTITVTADGYGTLKLPAGEFTNVLRVHRYEDYSDSASISGTPFIIPYTGDSYIWYTPGKNEILLSVYELSTGGSSGVTTTYTNLLPSALNETTGQDAIVQIYPNPVASQLNLKFRTNSNSSIRISLLDMTGREISVLADGYFHQGEQVFNRSVSDLSNGIYLMRIRLNDQIINRKVEIRN